jgi:hypothetical protein
VIVQARENGASDARRPKSAPRNPPKIVPRTGPDIVSQTGIMALQRSVGNAAVARMMQDLHTHGAGCGHQQSEAPAQTEPVQRRSTVHKVLSSPGQPMDSALRREMEYRHDGENFGAVRVHTGPEADASAEEIGAEAYTSRNHIVFRKGVEKNKLTVAHELKHVLDQRKGTVPGVDNGNGLSISQESDPGELRADASAAHVMAKPLPTEARSGGVAGAEPVQRSPQRETGSEQHAGTGRETTPAARPGKTASGEQVQRMFSRRSRSARTQEPQQHQIRVGDEIVPMTWNRGFWVFSTFDGGRGYIDESKVRNNAVAPGMAGYVTRYMNGGFALYRGIPRWHPTWHQVTGNGTIPPLGRGELPDFDTHNTSFVPFAPTQGVARGAAVATKGMGRRDRAQFVNGYRRTQGDGEVGLMATVVATSSMDLGFFNETEIQIRGPVRTTHVEIFRMSTTEAEVGLSAEPIELRETRPGTPTEEDKNNYTARYGRLIP